MVFVFVECRLYHKMAIPRGSMSVSSVLKVNRPVKHLIRLLSSKFDRLDWDYLSNTENATAIRENVKRRKGVGDIDKVLRLKNKLDTTSTQEETDELRSKLLTEALKIPNRSHPSLIDLGHEPKVLKTFGTRRNFGFPPHTFDSLSRKSGLSKNDTSLFTGPRSYYLIDQLADLEAALVKRATSLLKSKGFQHLSVPDILPRHVIEDCGMDTRGVRSQVYSIKNDVAEENMCLSGTAEMGISSFLNNKTFCREDLPLKLVAVSRCYRAEASKISEEKGIYRVHQFTKVEMYGVYAPEHSAEGLDYFAKVQEEFFTDLGLELRILEMPECELGPQAFRKLDVEAYFPGKQMWGELTSTSNCTDYQSRRLNITSSTGEFLHTINGTACAIPRTIVALMETHQSQDGSVSIPKCLIPYLNYNKITRSRLPKMLPYKFSKKSERSDKVVAIEKLQ